MSAPAAAQGRPAGHVSLLADYLPNVERTAELRARLFAEQRVDAGPRLRLHLSGFVEGLIADRPAAGGAAHAAIARPQDLYADLVWTRFDLRAGLTRIVWGRLDEIQPGDVINPIDVSRFFFEGRSEARLPVPLVRARAFAGPAILEAVAVPAFRRGRFDELDEPSSPFNLARPAPEVACLAIGICPPPGPLPLVRQEPPVTASNLQGGGRVSSTIRRVDWAVSAYRGFRSFGVYELATPPVANLPSADESSIDNHRMQSAVADSQPAMDVAAFSLIQAFPRFTMLAADFETVRGPWGLRGEVAAFVRDTFQPAAPGGVPGEIVGGRSIEAGAGMDRRTGDYRVSGSLLVRHQSGLARPGLLPPDPPAAGPGPAVASSIVDPRHRDTGVSLIGGADRSFARETRRGRLFGVYNLSERTAFIRGIGALSLRDNLWIEASAGWFAGDGTDQISRFGDRDFLYLRVRAYF